MWMKRPIGESLVRIGIYVGIALALATIVPALPRALLRSELETSLRKWIVRDRQGNYVLLSPRHGSGTRGGLSLRMSQGSSPESLRDFGPAYALEPPLEERGVLISAGISLDHQDRIHLVWSTVTGLTGYAVVNFPGAGGTDLLWRNPQTQLSRSAGSGGRLLKDRGHCDGSGRKRLVHLDRVDHGSPGVDPSGPCP